MRSAEQVGILRAPLDVVVARKIGTPGQPELGIGAIAPGVEVLDKRSVHLTHALARLPPAESVE